MNIDDGLARCKVESKEKWMEWGIQIPALEFPPGWKIKITPPFAGAMVRFRVSTAKTKPNADVSVYLDVSDSLGCMGEPYWEVYPVEDDTERFLMNETDELIKCIAKALKIQEEKT